AWKIALQDARTNTGYVGSDVMYDETAISSAPPPYTAYATPSPEVYGYGYNQYNGAYPPAGPQVFYASNGQAYAVPYQYPYQGPYGQHPANHVIIRERYRDSDGDLALGMLAGAATGMALGSLFWVF
ncbi:Pleckstrin homology domain-containing family B member 2, partial [Leptosomus discolor]|uniref:pleckstrin homology domain-containing family B member 2-like n=1 Tax=Leptosomus discolor TaxID=188344 RepID=UPI0005223E18